MVGELEFAGGAAGDGDLVGRGEASGQFEADPRSTSCDEDPFAFEFHSVSLLSRLGPAFEWLREGVQQVGEYVGALQADEVTGVGDVDGFCGWELTLVGESVRFP